MELTTEEWDLIFLASQQTNLKFTKDDVIIQQDNKYSMVCQIISGSVRIEKQHVDCSVALAVLSPGEVFGEISFLCDTPASATVIANDDVELYVTSRPVLEELFRANPHAVLKFYHYLCSTIARRIAQQEKLFVNPKRNRGNSFRNNNKT